MSGKDRAMECLLARNLEDHILIHYEISTINLLGLFLGRDWIAEDIISDP